MSRYNSRYNPAAESLEDWASKHLVAIEKKQTLSRIYPSDFLAYKPANRSQSVTPSVYTPGFCYGNAASSSAPSPTAQSMVSPTADQGNSVLSP